VTTIVHARRAHDLHLDAFADPMKGRSMAVGNVAKAGTIGLAALPAVSGTLPSGIALILACRSSPTWGRSPGS